MPALNFPSNPTLDQIYQANGKAWRWNGSSWVGIGTPSLFTNGQSIAVTNFSVNGSFTANGNLGTVGQFLTSAATGNTYWSTVVDNSGTAYSNAIAYSSNANNLTSGTVSPARLPQANTTANGAVILLDSVSNTSISIYAATANSVKTAYDAAISANTRAASAQTAAVSAYSNAVSVASTDASTKAATAYSNAVSVASTDASTKAATAYSNAIAVASSDASTKAATAYSNAIAYAASNTYVNNTFAPKANPTFSGSANFGNVYAFGTVAGQELSVGGWTVDQGPGETLLFSFLGTVKMKLDQSGNLSVAGDVIAYETL